MHTIINKVIFYGRGSKYTQVLKDHSSLCSVVFLVCVDHISLNTYASQHIFLRHIYFKTFIFEACHLTIQRSSIHIITLFPIAFKPKHIYIENSLNFLHKYKLYNLSQCIERP